MLSMLKASTRQPFGKAKGLWTENSKDFDEDTREHRAFRGFA